MDLCPALHGLSPPLMSKRDTPLITPLRAKLILSRTGIPTTSSLFYRPMTRSFLTDPVWHGPCRLITIPISNDRSVASGSVSQLRVLSMVTTNHYVTTWYLLILGAILRHVCYRVLYLTLTAYSSRRYVLKAHRLQQRLIMIWLPLQTSYPTRTYHA